MSSYTITFSIMTFYMFNIFLFSTAFVLPGATNPFATFSESIGISAQGLPGAGTIQGATRDTVQAAKGAAITCAGGVIGGIAFGFFAGGPVGAIIGAVAGGIIGCALIPSSPVLTSQIADTLDNSGLGALTDTLATFGVIMRWVGFFLVFVIQLAGYGFILFGVDPVIGPYLTMINGLFIAFMIFIVVNVVRGRGG